jgi:hypothetical protein
MGNSPIHSRHSARLSNDARPPLTICVFYCDVPAANEAAELMDRLTRRFGSELEVEINYWNFEVLRLPEVFDTAMRRAAEGDLVVVAPGEREIPSQLRDCLESALMMRGSRSLAVVALLGGSEAEAPARDYLKSLCRHPDDSFFCTHDSGMEDGMLTPHHVRQRANSSSSVLDAIMNRPVSGVPRKRAS